MESPRPTGTLALERIELPEHHGPPPQGATTSKEIPTAPRADTNKMTIVRGPDGHLQFADEGEVEPAEGDEIVDGNDVVELTGESLEEPPQRTLIGTPRPQPPTSPQSAVPVSPAPLPATPTRTDFPNQVEPPYQIAAVQPVPPVASLLPPPAESKLTRPARDSALLFSVSADGSPKSADGDPSVNELAKQTLGHAQEPAKEEPTMFIPTTPVTPPIITPADPHVAAYLEGMKRAARYGAVAIAIGIVILGGIGLGVLKYAKVAQAALKAANATAATVAQTKTQVEQLRRAADQQVAEAKADKVRAQAKFAEAEKQSRAAAAMANRASETLRNNASKLASLQAQTTALSHRVAATEASNRRLVAEVESAKDEARTARHDAEAAQAETLKAYAMLQVANKQFSDDKAEAATRARLAEMARQQSAVPTAVPMTVSPVSPIVVHAPTPTGPVAEHTPRAFTPKPALTPVAVAAPAAPALAPAMAAPASVTDSDLIARSYAAEKEYHRAQKAFDAAWASFNKWLAGYEERNHIWAISGHYQPGVNDAIAKQDAEDKLAKLKVGELRIAAWRAEVNMFAHYCLVVHGLSAEDCQEEAFSMNPRPEPLSVTVHIRGPGEPVSLAWLFNPKLPAPAPVATGPAPGTTTVTTTVEKVPVPPVQQPIATVDQ